MSNIISFKEEWITTSDGQEIYTKQWNPAGTPIATLVMVHGFSEHSNRYDRLFSLLSNQGIECYCYDQRGWGQTCKKSGRYGDNQGYDTALRDVDEAIKRKKSEDVPLFLMGHSMGGGIVLNYLASKHDGVSMLTGAIASAPLVTLSMKIPAYKYYPMRYFSKLLPSFMTKAGLSAKGMSHDEEAVKNYLEDPLVHDFATIGTIKGFLDAGQDILDNQAKKIKTPILYSHGDADPINAYDSTAKAFQLTASKDKELKTWPGLYHELHNEKLPERQQVAECYIDWIKKHCNTK
ncbi:alpha/beta-hydrolase [Backusella circina FSU 941]|nr:alpha/beta-hydrolase [Backusella circina FSU 941]